MSSLEDFDFAEAAEHCEKLLKQTEERVRKLKSALATFREFAKRNPFRHEASSPSLPTKTK